MEQQEAATQISSEEFSGFKTELDQKFENLESKLRPAEEETYDPDDEIIDKVRQKTGLDNLTTQVSQLSAMQRIDSDIEKITKIAGDGTEKHARNLLIKIAQSNPQAIGQMSEEDLEQIAFIAKGYREKEAKLAGDSGGEVRSNLQSSKRTELRETYKQAKGVYPTDEYLNMLMEVE